MGRLQEVFISINSKDRLPGPWTENKYRVQLPRLLQNVIKIELLSAEIPNTLYESKGKTLFFSVHVNPMYPNPNGLIPENDLGGMYVCVAKIPEGIYTHDEAAVELTASMGVVRVYGSTELIRLENNDPAAGTEALVDPNTKDIAKVPDSPDSADSDANKDILADDDPYGEGEGIMEEEVKSDMSNDPLAVQPYRESELGFLGTDPPIILGIPENDLLRENVRFLFDKRMGKLFAQVNNVVFDNFVVELAQTTPELGFTTHRPESKPDERHPGFMMYYSTSVSQLYSTSHIWMTIDELVNMPYWNVISTNKLPKNVFARIQLCTDIMHWVFWSQGIEEFKRVCAPGMAVALETLTIGWLDQYGNPTNFHGTDHTLLLKVTQSPPD
jgi:hypothetical protein